MTIYVSQNGRDEYNGKTKAQAVRSIQKALSLLARQPDGVLCFTGKDYFLDAPILLTPAHNGLTLTTEDGTALSGALPLGKLHWQKDAKTGIYQTALPAVPFFDRMFADGKEQTLCRYPNRKPGALPLEGAATKAEIRLRAKSWANPAGGQVRAIHPAGWGGNSFLILDRDEAADCGLRLQWVGDNNRGDGMADALVVENVREELDAPGEWFFDKAARILYWLPPEGTEPDRCAITLSVQTELLLLQGASPAEPVRRISVRGLTIRDTARTLFPSPANHKKYEPPLRGDWCVVRSGAVFAENAEDCSIENCIFQNIGGNALFFSGYHRRHRLTGCTFSDIGATAVQIAGKPSAVYEPSFWEHKLYPDLPVHRTAVSHPEKTGPRKEDYPADILVEQNHIYRVGLLEKQSCGVNLSVAYRISILHNTMHHSPRALININDGTFGGHEIAYNDLFDSQRETEDHGPINSWGRDRFWSVPQYNASGLYGSEIRHTVKDGKEYDLSGIDCLAPTRIHHNRLHHAADAPHSWGIDMDDGSSHMEIDHNLLLGLGVKLREGFDRRVHHNLLVGGSLQMHVPYAEARDAIFSNCILNPKPVGLALCDGERFQAARIRMEGNFLFSPSGKPRMPAFLPKQVLLHTCRVENGSWCDAPADWADFAVSYYGQQNCPQASPTLPPPAAKRERRKYRIKKGALCVAVDEAIRSAKAAPDCDGWLVIRVLLPGRNTRLQKGDILKKDNSGKCLIWRDGQIISL